MNYVKLSDMEYPVTRDQIKSATGACIPLEPTDADLVSLGYACVEDTDAPSVTVLQVATETTPEYYNGKWHQAWTTVDKSQEEIDNEAIAIKNSLLDLIDNNTDMIITEKFVYNTQSVRMNGTDQVNYEGKYNFIKDLLGDGQLEVDLFPVNYKVATNADGSPVFITMNTFADLKAFIYAGKVYIETCLQEGWILKQQVLSLNLEQLSTWTDTRI